MILDMNIDVHINDGDQTMLPFHLLPKMCDHSRKMCCMKDKISLF